MARCSVTELVVLDYGPRTADRERYAQRRWLALPVWAFRVLAPRPAPRPLNLLQAAVLTSLRASASPPSQLGARLGVHQELVTHVEHELTCAGYVDAERRPTKRGVEVLRTLRDHDTELVALWVFVDADTGSPWPHLASSLARLEHAPSDGEYPRVLRERQQKPLRPWVLHHSGSPPCPPSSATILRVAAEHARLQRWELDLATEARPLMERLRAVDDDPVRVHLLTHAYAPKDSKAALEWRVCDPFGHGANSSLRRRLARRAETDTGLAGVLATVLGSENTARFDEYRRAVEKFALAAARDLHDRLGSGLERYPVVAGHLQAGFADLHASAQLGGPSQIDRSRSALGAWRRVLEATLAELARRWPLAGVEQRWPLAGLDPDLEQRRETLERSAVICGLGVPPQALVRVERDALRSVVHGNHWKLRAAMTATVLRGATTRSHPLHRAAQVMPNLLRAFEDVVEAAGDAIHGGDVPIFARVEELGAITVELVGALLSLGPHGDTGENTDG